MSVLPPDPNAQDPSATDPGAGGGQDTTGTSLAAPPSTTTTADKYGLGQFGQTFVAINDPNFLSGAGTVSGLKPRDVTGDQIIEAFIAAGRDDPRAVAQVQIALYEAGYYSAAQAKELSGRLGTINADDIAVLGHAVVYSARTGVALDGDMAEKGKQRAALGIGTGGQAYETLTHDVRVTNPDDLAYYADKGFQNALGRKATPDEKARFIATFQGSQRAAQQTVFDAQDQARAAYIGAKSGDAGAGIGATRGQMTPAQIAQSAYNAGFRGSALVTATAVAMAESAGNPAAHNGTAPDDSWGLWQVNYYGNLAAGRTAKYGPAPGQVDPNVNASAAFDISGGGKNFKPWSTFTNGAYKTYLAAAQSAAGSVSAGGYAPTPPPGPADPNRGTYEPSHTNNAPPPATPAVPVSDVGSPVPGASAPMPPVSQTVNVVEPPSADVEADATARREHPLEAGAHDRAQQYATLLKLITAGAGQ